MWSLISDCLEGLGHEQWAEMSDGQGAPWARLDKLH